MPRVRTSTETLEAFRTLLVLLAEDIAQAVAMGDHEVKQTLHRLKFERPRELSARIRVLERRWQDAQTELRRKRSLPTPTGAPPSTVVERRAAERAKRELETTKDQLEATLRWARAMEQEAMQYRGQTAGARDAPCGLLPRAAGHLAGLITELEAYAATTTPHTAPADSIQRGDGAPPDPEPPIAS